jgi:hypothetical protein
MDILTIFGSQLALSLLVYTLLAKWYVVPWLADKPIEQALIALIFPHALRHLGLTFFVPGVVEPSLPHVFANAAAYGDLVSGLLAILCLFALRRAWALALPLVWVFNIVGTLDLVNALSHAEAVPSLGASWYIPTFFVPMLLVTHVMIFARLLKRSHQPVAASAI